MRNLLHRQLLGLTRPSAYRDRSLIANAVSYGGACTRFLSTIPGSDASEEEETSNSKSKGDAPKGRIPSTLFKMLESAATTFASLAVLGLAGYGYHLYYKRLVLRKVEKSFQPGDPMLELAGQGGEHGIGAVRKMSDEEGENWIERPEQATIDRILNGTRTGRYYLLIGEKGTGKSSMLLEAMRKVDGEGISMFEAHADVEIFRIRLGRALNYEFNEDYIGSLFSVRGPRDTTALLDVERALTRLEKVALKRRRDTPEKGPLVLIVNGTHLIRDDEDGRDLVEQLQQKAELWAASNLVTMVFNSDDFWIYERMKRYATRMDVIPILDLPKDRAMAALAYYRNKYFPRQRHDDTLLKQVYDSVGGRLQYLNAVAKAPDMLQTCKTINETEKNWFLNRCGLLGENMDDDVMDQQKYASAAMVLARALVKLEQEMEFTYDDGKGHILPQLPLHKARLVMTRADFISEYDHDNLFTIDSTSMVRADSVPMMNAFREICNEEGFDDFLQDTLDRISAIESLNRTKEITMKDLWIEQQGEIRGKYILMTKDKQGRDTGTVEFAYKENEKTEEDADT